MKIRDRLTAWLPFVGVLGFLLSAATGWEQFLSGPHTHLTFGPYAFFKGQKVIGLSCVFINEGAKQDSINFMTAEIDGRHQTLRSIWTSLSTEQWVQAAGLSQKPSSETQFTDFVPIAVPSKGNVLRIVWFTSDNSYGFEPGDYRIIFRGYGSDLSDVRTHSILELALSSDIIKDLKENPQFERAVRTRAWHLPPQ
jgi:hypothetical protein